jgi:hypothetical protein
MPCLEESIDAKIRPQVERGKFEFASGKNINDLINFILYHMYNWIFFNGATTDDEKQEDNKDTFNLDAEDDIVAEVLMGKHNEV